MMIILTILGLIIFFGIVRIIAQPRKGFWGNFYCIIYLDVISKYIDEIREYLNDRN